MRLMLYLPRGEFLIVSKSKSKAAIFDTHIRFEIFEDLIESYLSYPIIWSIKYNYKNNSNYIDLGGFKKDDDLKEKFAEYLI